MLIKNIVSLDKENPPVPPKKKSTSGKKNQFIHGRNLSALLMVVFG